MENQNNNNYDFEDESPPSLLSSSGGWWQNIPRKPLIVGGAGAVLVILLMISLFSRGSGRTDHATVQLPDYDVMERMQGRFERLEDRMEQIEMQLTRLPGLIHQVERMETGGNAGQIEQMINRIERMNQGMEEIRKETTALKTQQQQLATRISDRAQERAVAAATTPERKTSAAAASYHEVKKGDTLFSIARTNGITLNTLLENNNLTRESVIKPGDRLILK